MTYIKKFYIYIILLFYSTMKGSLFKFANSAQNDGSNVNTEQSKVFLFFFFFCFCNLMNNKNLH